VRIPVIALLLAVIVLKPIFQPQAAMAAGNFASIQTSICEDYFFCRLKMSAVVVPLLVTGALNSHPAFARLSNATRTSSAEGPTGTTKYSVWFGADN
jgi:hypothetical protein